VLLNANQISNETSEFDEILIDSRRDCVRSVVVVSCLFFPRAACLVRAAIALGLAHP